MMNPKHHPGHRIEEDAAVDAFDDLLKRVEQGEEITICRGGKSIARLVPIEGLTKPRVGGQWKGLVRIREDFDAPLPGFGTTDT